MKVIKRDGSFEQLDVAKVHKCVIWACEGLTNVSVSDVEANAHIQFFDGITTDQIHKAMIKSAAELISVDAPDYEYVAARLLLQHIMKECGTKSYSQYIGIAAKQGRLSKDIITHYLDADYVNLEKLNSAINHSRNLNFKYLGLQTLYDRYLIRDENHKVIESPQHFLMRVACGVCLNEPKAVATEKAIELYNLYSNFEFIQSTPTLFNAGTNFPQMSSCFVNTFADSAYEPSNVGSYGNGIMGTLTECAMLSKHAGGVGSDFTFIRPSGSSIGGTKGKAAGVAPYLKLFNDVALGFDQSGKRKGSFAAFLEPWHGDIEVYIDLKKPTGDERVRARDIFPYSWIPDLFMRRVEEGGLWSLFDSHSYPELHTLYGEEFEKRYVELEQQGAYIKQLEALPLWRKMIETLAETGSPMNCFKDEFNRRNPQKHVGSILSSNLCVAHDTQVLTDDGYRTISAMIGEFVNVWNGEEFSNVQIIKTGERQKLLKVTTTTGNTLECTEYHKFYVLDGDDIVEKRTIELQVGDRLIPFNSPNEFTIGYKVSHIESVIDEGLVGDTYCFNEPKRHMGVFNGLLTGNCSEIALVTNNDETAVCNLGSINVAQIAFDDIKRIVPIAVRALDNVIDKNFYPSEKARYANMRNRPIGLGIMGWYEYLVKNDIDFESEAHLTENDRVFDEISYWAIKTSVELAKEKGRYQTFEGSDWSKGVLPIDTAKDIKTAHVIDTERWEALRQEVITCGLRNSLLMAIAPTATIANILGTTPSIEPPYKLTYMESNLSGKFRVIDPVLRYGKPQFEKTAFDIDQDWVIKAAAVRQKYIDQSQSVNLFKSKGIKGRVISNWYFLAWRLGLKSTYYLKQQITDVKRENLVIQEEPKFCSIDTPDCEACQ